MEWIAVLLRRETWDELEETAEPVLKWCDEKLKKGSSCVWLENMMQGAKLKHMRLKRIGGNGKSYFVVEHKSSKLEARLYPAYAAPKLVNHDCTEWDIEDGTDTHYVLDDFAEAKDLETAVALAEKWMNEASAETKQWEEEAIGEAFDKLDADYQLLSKYIESNFPEFGPMPKQAQHGGPHDEA